MEKRTKFTHGKNSTGPILTEKDCADSALYVMKPAKKKVEFYSMTGFNKPEEVRGRKMVEGKWVQQSKVESQEL